MHTEVDFCFVLNYSYTAHQKKVTPVTQNPVVLSDFKDIACL